jgi:hypothetical protein
VKLEIVHELLQEWGELIITTAAGDRFEIHLGDTQFDMERRLLTLRSPQATYVIDGDAIENVTKHYGHRMDG